VVLAAFVYIRSDRIIELYTQGIKPGRDVLDSDYLYILILTLLSYYPVYLAFSSILPSNVVEINVFGLYIFFTLTTIAIGIYYTVAYAPVWYRTMGGDGGAVLGMLMSVMFGAFFATHLAVGLSTDTSMIRRVYGYYVDVALDILKLVSMMAILPVIQRFIEYAYQIFKNNITVAFRGALFAAIGGVVGAGTLLALIPLFTTATIAGIFSGILLRNNIESGLAPIASLLAVLGVPPFWHTFYEFAAFSLISASVGMLVYSVVHRQERRLKLSVSGIVVGAMILLFGAFNEVTVSASVAGVLRSVLDFSPVISDISYSSAYIMAAMVSVAFVIVISLVVVYSIELIIRVVGEVSA